MTIKVVYRCLSILTISVMLAGNGLQAQRLKIQLPPIDWTTGWAAGVKLGTLGPGVEAVKSVNQNWNARLGVSWLGFPVNRSVASGNLHIDLQSKVRLGGINLQTDFYFHPWYYFTGGLMVNLTRLRFTTELEEVIHFGDIEISPEDIGLMEIRVRPGWPVSPFLGVGIGNPMPAGRNIWFNVELGALYLGKPHFSIEAEGMIEPTANRENEKALKEHFKGFRFYPMLTAQVSYRIR